MHRKGKNMFLFGEAGAWVRGDFFVCFQAFGELGIKGNIYNMYVRKNTKEKTYGNKGGVSLSLFPLAADLPALAPIPRRAKMDKGANGRANPRRVRRTVEVTVFDADAHARGDHPFRRVECEVMARALSPAVTGLPLPLQEAVQAYAKALEDVDAGGASDPEAVAGGVSAGGAAKEGRQFHAVKQVEFWRRLDAAIGDGAVSLGAIRVPHRKLLRAVAVDCLSVAEFLAALGLPRSNARRLALLSAVLHCAEALAQELGFIEPREEKTPARKKPVDGAVHHAAGHCHVAIARPANGEAG